MVQSIVPTYKPGLEQNCPKWKHTTRVSIVFSPPTYLPSSDLVHKNIFIFFDPKLIYEQLFFVFLDEFRQFDPMVNHFFSIILKLKIVKMKFHTIQIKKQ